MTYNILIDLSMDTLLWYFSWRVLFFASQSFLLHLLILIEINADEVVNTVAIEVLQQIQDIIKDDETTDFEKVENIVLLFEKYGIDAMPCHNF